MAHSKAGLPLQEIIMGAPLRIQSSGINGDVKYGGVKCSTDVRLLKRCATAKNPRHAPTAMGALCLHETFCGMLVVL